MHVYVGHVSRESKPRTEPNTKDEYDIMKSMLKSIAELTLPIEVIDELIRVLKVDIVTMAGSVGNNVCDILEHVTDAEAIHVDNMIDNDKKYAQLVSDLKCLKHLLNYRDAAIRAGGK